MIQAGDIVTHPRFGSGAVVETRFSGYDAKVDFGGYRLWVPTARLELITRPRTASGERIPAGASLVHAPARIDTVTKTVIEAFRVGVVPDAGIREWTIGRDVELGAVSNWLANSAEGSLLIEGQYGSGKTHMLRYLSQAARDKGFAVAMVRIDPAEENSSFPFRFYASVMRALRIPINGAETDIRTAFRETVQSSGRTVLDDHQFYGPLIAATRDGRDSEEDWLGFMGERAGSRYFPSGLDFTTVANIACHLLSGLSRFMADDLKLAGMLILVDEAETAQIRRYAYHWRRTLNFLRGLTLVANDDEILDEPLTRNDCGVRIGRNTRLVYSGHYPDVRYYFKLPTFLKVALALTECDVVGKLREWRETQPRIALGDLDRNVLSDLFSRVAGAYGALYGAKIPRHLERWVLYHLLYGAYGAGNIRGFMKALLEVMDFVRHHPQRQIEDLESLRLF